MMSVKKSFTRCDDCSLRNLKGCNSGGDSNSEFVILGESPGHHEVKERSPFVGGSGKLVQGILCEYGIKLDDCYLVNAMNCRPSTDSGKRKAVDSCRNRVIKEIFSKERKVILAFGKYAYYALFGGSENKTPIKITHIEITQKRGKVRYKCKFPVVPTVHPRYAMQSSDTQFNNFLKDIKKAISYFKK